jgi:hypothetical protein
MIGRMQLRTAAPPKYRQAAPIRLQRPIAPKALEIDWSDSDTWVGITAAVLGLGLGIGAPIFYTSRIDEDEKNLDELRKLNRQNFKETGEYMTEVRCRFMYISSATGHPISTIYCVARELGRNPARNGAYACQDYGRPSKTPWKLDLQNDSS